MLQFTHVYVASLLESSRGIKNRGDYYLGATIPDARYFAGVQRERTHISRSEVKPTFGAQCSDDFLAGYDVHLAFDEYMYDGVNIANVVRMFPFFLRSFFDRSVIEVVFDFYCIERKDTLEKVAISDTYLSALENVGIDGGSFVVFVRTVKNMLGGGFFRAFRDEMMNDPRFRNNPRLTRLDKAVQFVEKHPKVQLYLLNRARPEIENISGMFVENFDIPTPDSYNSCS